MKVKPSQSCRKPVQQAEFCSPPLTSPLQYTSAWHRLSHSGLRRHVRERASTSKLHSTHLLIGMRGKKRKTGTLNSITTGNNPPPALCCLLGDWLLVSITLSLHPLYTHTKTKSHTLSTSPSPCFLHSRLQHMAAVSHDVKAFRVCSVNPVWKGWDWGWIN